VVPIAIAFGFTCQLLLLAYFAAHRWRRSAEATIGRLVYGLGAVALVLVVWHVVAGQPWYLVLAFGLYAGWAALGAWIDIIRPIPWRQPPRLSILLPYAAHTTLNVLAHRSPIP
jgi:hypothetical protein